MNIINPKPHEIDEVLDFMNQCDIAEFGEEDTSREDMEQLWSEIDLAQDAWIVRDEQRRVVGYANVSDAGEGDQMDIYIHPTCTPAGIEDDLMRLCIERAGRRLVDPARETQAFLIGYASSLNLRLQQVYEKSGFERHTYHFRMQIDLNSPVPPPEWPSNFHLADYRPEDEHELYTFIQRAFDWEGHKDTPIELWRNLVFRGGRFEPRLFVLIRDEGKLVGAALAYDEEGSGWIRQLAFDRDYRGRGLGSLLLRHMFTLFQQRGAASVGLGVAAVNENAISFYERCGMHRSREYIEYRKRMNQNQLSFTTGEGELL